MKQIIVQNIDWRAKDWHLSATGPSRFIVVEGYVYHADRGPWRGDGESPRQAQLWIYPKSVSSIWIEEVTIQDPKAAQREEPELTRRLSATVSVDGQIFCLHFKSEETLRALVERLDAWGGECWVLRDRVPAAMEGGGIGGIFGG